MAITDLGHPPRAGKMRVIDQARAFALGDRINPEDDTNDLVPIGIFRFCIE